MTDAPQPATAGAQDPTRDIRLPPLPGPMPPGMPHDWSGMPLSHATAGVDQPTDQLGPPGGRPRERTLAFASPEMAPGRRSPTVGPSRRREVRPARSRRWPWVVLSLLPIIVIVGAGIAWLLLLRSA